MRLAELVAALSLGIDLGFGQPMEHVLRQCLIALRLAERLGPSRGRARSSTTPVCSSTSAATRTRTSRPSGSATTSRCARSRCSNSVAQGLSNKEIGARLVISPKTAGNHVEHIYSKIDASSRAAASLFAMRHGLLRDAELAPSAAP